MIRPDAKVVAHTPPYRRIETRMIPAEPDSLSLKVLNEIARAGDLIEGERVWSLIRQSCGDEVQE